MQTRWFAIIAIVLTLPSSGSGQEPNDPQQLLVQADRLAWLKNWTRAEPLYAEAQRVFSARGERVWVSDRVRSLVPRNRMVWYVG